MGANTSRFGALLDVAAASTLRASGGADVGATATETAIKLHELKAAYWNDNDMSTGEFEVVFNVTKNAGTVAATTATLALVTDETAALSDSPVVVDSFSIVGLTGVFKRVLDSKTLKALDPDFDGTDRWIAARLTIAGGTSPLINYSAYITRVVRNG